MTSSSDPLGTKDEGSIPHARRGPPTHDAPRTSVAPSGQIAWFAQGGDAGHREVTGTDIKGRTVESSISRPAAHC